MGIVTHLSIERNDIPSSPSPFVITSTFRHETVVSQLAYLSGFALLGYFVTPLERKKRSELDSTMLARVSWIFDN